MNVLLLAGSAEARLLAAKIAGMQDVKVTSSLAGATRNPATLAGKMRIGHFGGRDGFADYLRQNSVDVVIDATHPFAAKMSETAAGVCAALGVSHLQVMRPPWTPDSGDRWTIVENECAVAGVVPVGSVAFLATGRGTLERYSNMTGRRLICRQIDPPETDFPFENGAFLVGQGPFSIGHEEALFKNLNVDWLVVKNSGGDASRSKLNAARRLGLPVAMIKRPPPLECARVKTVAEALIWLNERIQGR